MPRRRLDGRASTALTARVIQAGGGICYWCACPATTKDHYPVPLSHGGADELGNLVPACHPCNSARGDRPGPPARVCRRCGVAKHRRASATGLRPGW